MTRLHRSAQAAVLGLVALLMAASSAAAGPALAEGTWRSASRSEITIEECPVGYCGYLSRIVIPDEHVVQCELDPEAFRLNLVDYFNKDEQLVGRPLEGLQILTLRPTGNQVVFEGEIYNPQDGNVYSGVAELLDGDRMRLGGACMFGLCVQSEEWTRVPIRDEAPAFSCRSE